MKKFAVICILGALLFTGCSKGKDSEQNIEDKQVVSIEDVKEDSLFDENGSSTKQITLGYGYDNNDSLIFENEENTINTKITFDSGEFDLEVGLLVFVDGILQPVSVGNKAAEDLNVFKVNKQAEYDISFDLVSGDNGENVRIDTISLLNPNFEVTKNTKMFGLCFATTSPLAYETVCNGDIEAEAGVSEFYYEELTEEIKERYIIVKKDGSKVNNLENNIGTQYFQNGEAVTRLKVENGKLKFDLGVSGGMWKDYNIYVFYENEVQPCFDGKKYNVIKTNSDETAMMSVEIDMSDKEKKEYSQLFAVAVPVGDIKDNNVSVEKLPNIIVENVEE